MKYFLYFLTLSAFAAQFNPQKLEHRAETEGYGYKSANLMLLQELFGEQEHIKVPEFIALPSPIINELLAQAGLNLGKSWSEIIQAQGIASQTLGIALQTNVLPDSFADPSQALASQIKSKFN
ncbi:MAG: hypothetical protein JKY15_04600, partial [Deltaproteobacteria bacterium]|nr:hypothetical protein [Deltaproteobacteria bacterium]